MRTTLSPVAHDVDFANIACARIDTPPTAVGLTWTDPPFLTGDNERNWRRYRSLARQTRQKEKSGLGAKVWHAFC